MIDVGLGFEALDLAARDDRREALAPVAAEMRFEQRVEIRGGRRRRDRERQRALSARFVEQARDAGPQRQRFFAQRRIVAARLRRVQRGQQFLEVGALRSSTRSSRSANARMRWRPPATRSSSRYVPRFHHQLRPAARKRRVERAAMELLGVGERAVDVEDQRAKLGAHARSFCAARSPARRRARAIAGCLRPRSSAAPPCRRRRPRSSRRRAWRRRARSSALRIERALAKCGCARRRSM